MKAERADEPQGPKQRKKRPSGAKPKRVGQHGPIGFGSVMHDVKGGRPTVPGQLTQQGMGQGAQSGPGQDGKDGKATADPSAAMLLGMGMVPSTEQVVFAQSSGNPDTLSALGMQPDGSAQANGQQQAASVMPTPIADLGRMSPASLIDRVVDESTKLEIEAASRDLHVELDPVHLGPLIVQLRRDPNGRLDIRFRAREADAARILDAGSDMLRQQLADAGFTGARVAVDHDDTVVLGSSNG